MKNILWLENVDSDDVSKVGVKAAHLGEIQNIDVPTLSGFVTTKDAYNLFIRENNLRDKIETLLHDLELNNIDNLQRAGRQIRGHIREADMPEDFRKNAIKEYERLEEDLGVQNPAVRVSCSIATDKSSKTSMDEEVYLNISGKQELIKRIKDCYASLFTNSAISYREENNISHFNQGISVAVQEMSCSDSAVSGTMNTADPTSGENNIVSINASYGFEEYVKRSNVDPDNFKVFKESLGIIERVNGGKKVKLASKESGAGSSNEVVSKRVPLNSRERFCITDNQVKELSKYGLHIEEHYSQSMNIEWVLDKQSNQLHIIGANPQATGRDNQSKNVVKDYKLQEESQVLLQGESVDAGIESGVARVLSSPKQIDQFNEGEILVVDTTCPDWEPVMEKAGAIITNRENKHSQKLCRELGITAIIGTETATSQISDGQKITVDCSSHKGKIWEEKLEFSSKEYRLDKLPETETNIQVNIEDSDEALRAAQQIVASTAKADLTTMLPSEVGKPPLNLIEQNREDEYIEAVFSSIGKIGAAFYPKKTLICLSNFTNHSINKDSVFQKAFELECKAIRKAIDELRLDNIAVIVPLCRTVDEAKNVRARMKEYGLDQGEINVYMRAETPSNIIQGEEFAELFDGFSIETDNLSQLTLGIDKNLDKIGVYNEKSPSVKKSVETLIKKSHKHGEPVDICGYSPSEDEKYLEFLVKNNVDSVSVRPEFALETVSKIADAEEDKDVENADFLASSKVDIGSAAGQIYDLLNKKGKSTAERLKEDSIAGLDSDIVHQALGWLAKEGKVELEVKKNGEVKYHLD